ncbi:MAG: response regulator transcription factor [Anaerolineae bacterium]|nr:response regulator transcription factor [Anaerolineae bacterium]
MNNSRAISTLVVDDHPVVRMGITFALTAYDDISVVAQASRGEDALRLCAAHRPDVVLLDMVLPGMDGCEITRVIRARFPRTQVLILTCFAEPHRVADALRAGAVGYLVKDVSAADLAQAIRRASRGESTLHHAAAQALIERENLGLPPAEDLTDRQREVLALIVKGHSNEEIAGLLHIGTSTVRFHVSALLSKLGAANRTEAAVLAVRYHLVS